MTYQVLARKYRPQRFEDVVGQPHVTTLLQNAMRLGRISHAYLFSGPRGTGKTTTARLLAKALNCEKSEKPTPTPCGTCASCVEIADSRSLDVQEIDGASNRGIDQVRELRENVRYATSRGRYKVYIIDEVHMLTEQAFNALLKTLEEPPQHVVFVFATTEPHKVPATILSRCQCYDFRRIAPQETVERLAKIAAEEKIAVEPDCLALLARKSDGSLRDAESLLDQLRAATDGTLTVERARELLGMLPEEAYRDLLEHLNRGAGREALILAGKALDQGADLEEFISGFTEYLKDLLISGLENTEGGSAPQDGTAQDLLRRIGILVELGRDVKRSTQPRTLLEVALVRLARLDDSVTLSQVMEGLERLGIPMRPRTALPKAAGEGTKPREYKPDPEAPQPPPAPGKQGGLDLAAIEKSWDEAVDTLQKKAMVAGSFLASGRPVGYTGGVIQIAFPQNNAFSKEQVESKHRAAVEKNLSEFFNTSLRIGCTLAPPAPKAEGDASAAEGKTVAHTPLATGEDAEAVRRLLQAFEGEIV